MRGRSILLRKIELRETEHIGKINGEKSAALRNIT
jgi:hypothetical protein